MPITRRTVTQVATLVAVVLGLSLWLAGGAAAKFGMRLLLSESHPHVGQPVSVLIRSGPVGSGPCRMRLVAVAPGINRYRALDAFINGGYGVMGPSGPSFHRLRATRRLGFLVRMHRSSPTTWRRTLKFPRRGRWQLIVPNWCAPGYATPLPAIRTVKVR